MIFLKEKVFQIYENIIVINNIEKGKLQEVRNKVFLFLNRKIFKIFNYEDKFILKY